MNPENKTNDHLNQDNLDLVSAWSNLKNERWSHMFEQLKAYL